MNTPNNLQRFIDAQETNYERALAEVEVGKKQSHWMWYIFPQVQGLAMSETSRRYAINDLQEAAAYLGHPVLGSRLVNLCNILLALNSNNAFEIFGSPDDAKLKSSMTLFDAVNVNPVFRLVLDKFYNGSKDTKTLEILGINT